MILFYFLYTYCLIKKLEKDKHIGYVNNLLSQTVVLMETELLYRPSAYGIFKPVADYDKSKTLIDIYANEENDWKNIQKNGRLVAEYERSGAKNSFFFTASDNKYYLYEFSSDLPIEGEYALRTNIYEGRQKDPRIISQTDNQIKELSKHMEQGIEYTKLINDVQKLDALAAVEYKTVTESISRIVMWAILLKIVMFYCMFYYFNRKLRHFYISKKIIRN
ncbi:hypothetical protein GVAV_003159 [Gurleya vavrai]